MRFQDWDILLFPAGEGAAHGIPLQEFRTACYSEQHDPTSPLLTPLLTTFVPSLERGAPFQISLHSWTKTASVLAKNDRGSKPKEVWQVKVVVDGQTVANEHIPMAGSWPQVISKSPSPNPGEEGEPLKFPPFHRTLTTQSHWDPSDPVGRIRVELCAGYVDPKKVRFHKLHAPVNFAFQPAPIDVLEGSGIAWPNLRMHMNPLYANTYYRNVTPTPVPTPRRLASNNILGSPMPFTGLDSPGMLDASNPFVQYANGMQDTSTRSTSAYSNITNSAAPLFPSAPAVPTYPAAHGETTPKNPQVQFRLPSDQLQMILKAMSPASSDRPDTAPDSTNMPPPPLPTLTTVHKGTEFPSPQYPSLGSPFRSGTTYSIDRRADSRYSDVSMHAGCNDFPSCTSEDAEGRLVHSNPTVTPATVVKGKKEGSSPAKPRDFFSTILDVTAERLMAERSTAAVSSTRTTSTPAKLTSMPLSSPGESIGKKRTRSALRLLNLNDDTLAEKEGLAQPPRKASRASLSSPKFDKDATGVDEQENMMLEM